MLDLLSNTYVIIGMAVALIGLGAVLFLNKKGTG
ncbi:MAG: LPXTG cell wall anchor domain-containing protein [Planctomycetes bacterium]|nr:LPXTG cell wall anchor domain-containing protein [Planctomycetota bacterium]